MDYINYIFNHNFGDFDEEENLIIDKFLVSENQNEYFDSETLQVLICYFIENQDFEKIDDLLQRALKMYPNDEEIRFLEVVAAAEKSIEKALELTEKCIAKYSDRLFFLIKAILLFELNDFENGEDAFYDFIEKVDDKMEKTDMYYRTAAFLCRADVCNYDTDEETDMQCTLLIKKLVDYAVSQEFSEEDILYFAEQFFIWNHIKEAKLAINKAIDDNSYNLKAWQMLSEINVAAGDFREATDAFLYRIALNDNDKNLYFNCALCFQKSQKYKEAIEYFDLQMDKYPDELEDINFFCDILAAQGDCYMALEIFDEAKNKFNEVLKINKNHFKALVLLAKCFYNQDDNEKALKYLEYAQDIDTDFDSFDYDNLYIIIGQIYEDISENSPNQKADLINALMAYQKSLIHLNLARKIDTSYEDLDNKIAFMLCQIGKIHLLLGNDMHALMNLQLAFHLDENIPLLNIFLVIVYMNLGLSKDVLVHYQMISNEELELYSETFPQLKYFEKFKKNEE